MDDINYVFEDGDKDKRDLIRCCEEHFGSTADFFQKDRNVAFQAADLLAYEHLLVNAKISEIRDRTLTFDELRHPLKALSAIPGGRNGDDWGIHREDDMTASCIEEGIPLRNAKQDWPD